MVVSWPGSGMLISGQLRDWERCMVIAECLQCAVGWNVLQIYSFFSAGNETVLLHSTIAKHALTITGCIAIHPTAPAARSFCHSTGAAGSERAQHHCWAAGRALAPTAIPSVGIPSDGKNKLAAAAPSTLCRDSQ